MGDEPTKVIVEANIPASEAEEVLDPKATDAELFDDALGALVEPQAGGARPERKKGESKADYEERVAAWEQRQAEKAAQAGVGAGQGAPAEDVTMAGTAGDGAGSAGPPAPKRAAVESAEGKPVVATILPLTQAAGKNLVERIDGVAADVAAAADRVGARLLENLPGLLTAGATGAATKVVIDNPYTVAQLANTLMGVATAAVQRLGAGPDVGQYTLAIEMIAGSVGDFAGAVRDVATAGPGFGISTALLILRYRAHRPGGAGSLRGQIVADARAVANLAAAIISAAVGAGAEAAPTAQEAVSMASEYFFAAIVEAAKRAREAATGALGTARAEAGVAALREGARGTKRKRATGEGAEEMTAAVSAAGPQAAGPGPVEGTIAVASSKTPPDLKSVIDRLAGISPAEKSALMDVLARAGMAVAGLGAGAGAMVAGLGAGAGAMVSGVGRRLSGVFGSRGQGSGVAPSDVPLPRTETGPVPVPSSLLPPPRRPLEEAKEPEDVAMSGTGAGAAPSAAPPSSTGSTEMDVDKPEGEKKEKGGRRRKTSKNKRKTYRKKGKKTRGKTRGRRSFIY